MECGHTNKGNALHILDRKVHAGGGVSFCNWFLPADRITVASGSDGYCKTCVRCVSIRREKAWLPDQCYWAVELEGYDPADPTEALIAADYLAESPDERKQTIAEVIRLWAELDAGCPLERIVALLRRWREIVTAGMYRRDV